LIISIIKVYIKIINQAREDEMAETRKIRADLTAEEKARLEKFGSISFKSIRRPDMRVEKYIPSREQH
jgi:hypothetical protein